MLTASPHCNVESPITGSTVAAMIARAKSLGRTHFAYTEPGRMTEALRGYDKATKAGLKFIAGLQVFFKDTNCDIVSHTRAAASRYSKLTLYARDQKGYHALVRLASKDKPVTVSYGQEFGLLNWDDLRWAASEGLVAVSATANDIVFKPLAFGQSVETCVALANKLKSVFGAGYAVAVADRTAARAFCEIVEITLAGGDVVRCMGSDFAKTDRVKGMRGIRVSEIAEHPGRHAKLLSVNSGGMYRSYDQPIVSVTSKRGFVAMPDDIEAKANQAAVEVANRLGVPLLYTDYPYYATREDRVVQDVRLAPEGMKEYGDQHMRETPEAEAFLVSLGLDAAAVLSATSAWATQFDGFKLAYKPVLPAVPGGRDSLEVVWEIIKKYGRLPREKQYAERLKNEIDVLRNNGVIDLLPYFLPIRDIIDVHEKQGDIVGPGRGSAAGSLLAYLIGITHVDPIKYELSFERFLSLDRVRTGSFPDIDTDFMNRRHIVGDDGRSGYLYGTYGDRAAQASTRTMLRLKSAIKDVNRYFKGVVEPEVELLTKSLPDPPQGIADQDFVFGYEDDDGNQQAGLLEINEDLQKYAHARPQEWDVVQRCLGLTRQWSRHASAFVISDNPITATVPTFLGNATQYEAKGCERAGMIKYDFLVVKALEDVDLCIKLINKKNQNQPGYGRFTHNGVVTDIWSLPEDPEAFKSIWAGETETVFQLHTAAMTPFVKRIRPKSIIDLATISALVRPGPLDFVDAKTGRNMADEYVWRRDGRSQADVPELLELLPETYGILVFQEQVSKVSRVLGGMDPLDAEELRRLFSKKEKVKAGKMKPKFMAGAVAKVGAEVAETIWQQMETFSRYGFAKSHAVSYAFISYACMYLKHHFPLEWWTAVLSNADESEISGKLYRYVRDLMISPDINHSTDAMTIDYDRQKIRAKLTVIRGLGGSAVKPIVDNRPYADIKDFVKKRVAGDSLTKKLIHVGVLDSLFSSQATLMDKMAAYEQAVAETNYEAKIAEGKKPKPPKAKPIDPKYLGMHPIDDYVAKKQILATMPMRLSDVVLSHGGILNEGAGNRPVFSDSRGYTYPFINGDGAQRLESKVQDAESKNLYYCCAAYVVESKEFSYGGGSKKALKFVVDIDGHLSERVLWPSYDSGELKYPDGFGKGSVALLFMARRPGKTDSAIYDIRLIKTPAMVQAEQEAKAETAEASSA